MTAAAMVFLGSGLGGVLRFAMYQLFVALGWLALPLATMAVNVAGSLAIGMLIAAAERGTGFLGLGEGKAFLMTGLLGGFTTFSAFSADALNLFHDGQAVQAALYVLGSVVLSLLAVAAGYYLMRGGAA